MEEWNAMSQASIHMLIQSMPRRCRGRFLDWGVIHRDGVRGNYISAQKGIKNQVTILGTSALGEAFGIIMRNRLTKFCVKNTS